MSTITNQGVIGLWDEDVLQRLRDWDGPFAESAGKMSTNPWRGSSLWTPSRS